MPRIVTIVSPEVPHVTMFMGAALARTPDVHVSRTPDDSLVRFIDGEHPKLAALDVPHPFAVTEPKEVKRVVGVLPPSTWEPPVVLTRCMLPTAPAYDMWVQVVADVAGMSGGFAVERGEVVTTPQPWPWSEGDDGLWRPDPAWHQEQVKAFYARTGRERPTDSGDSSSAPTA